MIRSGLFCLRRLLGRDSFLLWINISGQQGIHVYIGVRQQLVSLFLFCYSFDATQEMVGFPSLEGDSRHRGVNRNTLRAGS